MKSLFAILAVALLHINVADGQDVFIEMKTSLSNPQLKYDLFGTEVKDEYDGRSQPVNFQLAVSTRTFKYLFIKATVGTNNNYYRTSRTWTHNENQYHLIGGFSLNQNFIEITPEFRFLKNDWAFINFGMGISQITRTQKDADSRLYKGNTLESIDFPNFKGTMPFATINIGGKIMYKNIGLLLELGIRNSATSNFRNFVPGLGVNKRHIRLGIVYHLGSKDEDEVN